MNRRSVLRSIGSVGALSSLSGIAVGKGNEYPRHDGGRSLEDIGNYVAFHPSQDRAAFISAAFEAGVELYIAEGVRSESDTPTEVYQITSDTTGGVYGPEWKNGNRLSFQRNLSRYTVKVPRSYKVLEHKIEKENVVDVEATLENATRVDE